MRGVIPFASRFYYVLKFFDLIPHGMYNKTHKALYGGFMKFLIYFMVYSGSALMAFNIFLYLRFARYIRKGNSWSRESRILNFPIFLLILFLVGYLAVGIFGKPDIIMSAILFGGSIFVSVMLWLIWSAVGRIQESEHLKAKLSAAEEASKSKTFFLSNMSHDLRTPLNAIIGYTTLAKAESDSH